MSKTILRNVEYKVKGINYNRTVQYDSKYAKGLLRVEPYQDVRITVIGYNYDDLEVVVDKYDNNGKHLSRSEGTIAKNDLVNLLGMD